MNFNFTAEGGTRPTGGGITSELGKPSLFNHGETWGYCEFGNNVPIHDSGTLSKSHSLNKFF